jgi:hypothetical protein
MARGGYWAFWYPPNQDEDLPHCICDAFLTAREAIASEETSVEQSGGGAVAISQIEGRPAVLLRKFGHLFPEADAFKEGDQIGDLSARVATDGHGFRKGQKVYLRLFDLPTRKERRHQRRGPTND